MNGPAEEQVRQLVREIRSHETERNRIGRDAAAEVLASRLQAEIFRKFAIIEAIKNWNDDVSSGGGGAEAEGSQARELKELVSNARKDTKAEAEDLKFMRIPRSGLRGLSRREELEYFPNYLDLPEVVRTLILGELTSTWDKLNVIKAMPSEGELMNWNETNLQFHLVFPILMARNSLDSVDILKLMAVNPSFEQSIKVHFEKRLHEPIEPVSEDWWSFKYKTLNIPIPELMTDEIRHLDTIPFPVDYLLEVRDVGEIRNIVNNELRSLAEPGTKIWNFSVMIRITQSGFSNVDIMRFLRDCTRQMPNLRRLDVTIISDDSYVYYGMAHPRPEQDVQDQADQIKAVALPDLPHLVVLNLHEPYDDPYYIPIWKCFLQKYQVNLVGTRITSLKMFPEFARLPRLEQVYLYERPTRWELLSESPLKCFRIEDLYKRRTPEEIAEYLTNLMENLSSRFGETLEKLILEITNRDGSGLRTALNQSWIMNWSFPNVKKLVLRISPNHGDSTLLLRFPKTEFLEVASKVGELEGFFCHVLDLSEGVDSVKKSNVWKFLPFLRTIKIYQLGSYGYDRPLRPILTVDRSECYEVENNGPA